MKKRIGAALLCGLLLVMILTAPPRGIADSGGTRQAFLQCAGETVPSILIYVAFLVLVYLVIHAIATRKGRQERAKSPDAERTIPEKEDNMTDYESLAAQAKALIEGVPHRTANLANLSALIYETLPDLNWAGFYFLENGVLVLGPFQGRPACIEIPVEKGVCGAAVRENRSQLVRDVHAFEGHIACDSASRSELVVPIHKDGVPIGVLDLDSPSLSRFTEADREGLERVVRVIETEII